MAAFDKVLRNKASERHPISDWQYEVANGDTRRGYDDWLDAKLDEDNDDPRDRDAPPRGITVLDAPDIPWTEAITYDVDTNENWRPAVCFVTRRISMYAPAITMRVHGPFTGVAGAAMARTVANALNHYTRGPDLWPALTDRERGYIFANKGNTAPYVEDDDIPF